MRGEEKIYSKKRKMKFVKIKKISRHIYINPVPKFLTGPNCNLQKTKKKNLTEKLKFVLGWVENIVGKREYAG